MEIDLKDRLAEIYYQFMIDMRIGKGTGIVNYDSPNDENNWRFATMPFVGRKYNDADPKILFIGLDMGKDINKKGNTYLSFGERHDTILGICKNKNKENSTDKSKGEKQNQEQNPEPVFKYNPHIAGTYAIALAILSQCDKYKSNDKWGHEWGKLSKDQNLNKKTQTLVNKYRNNQDEKERKNNVLEYVALTNLFKFVTVERDKAAGNDNRSWTNITLELGLFKQEIEQFKPNIIILQGSGKYLHKEIAKHEFDFFEYCSNKKIIVVDGCHPSAWIGGWDKIKGVKKLLKKYNNEVKKMEGSTVNCKS